MKKALSILVLISLPFLLTAQKDLRQGYIITLKGDTISGRIDFRGDIYNARKCIFYYDFTKVEEYLPFEIKSYRFKNGKYYISKNIEKQDTIIQVFAEYLVDGQKDLFYFRSYSDFYYLLSLNDSSVVEIPYYKKVLTKDGRHYQYESTNHIGYLKSYFNDCPSIFPKIQNIKKPNSKELISITKEYHELTCGDGNCIVYNKNKSPFKFAIEPHYSAISKYLNISNHLKEFGGLLYVWLPQSNEKLYFKTGFLYSKDTIEGISNHRIPIQFEYLFPNKLIRPKFDIGLNLYHVKRPEFTEGIALTMATAGGILIRVTNNIFVNLNIEADLFQFTNKTDFLISRSFGFGLFILL